MAKSKSVRKSAKEKKAKALAGAKLHQQNMYKTRLRKMKEQLDRFIKQQEVIRQHKENTLGAAADSVYGNMTE
jgi:hypothetical protein